MLLFDKIFKIKVRDKSDTERLMRARNERPLREGYNHQLYLEALEAKNYLFNETVELKRLDLR